MQARYMNISYFESMYYIFIFRRLRKKKVIKKLSLMQKQFIIIINNTMTIS